MAAYRHIHIDYWQDSFVLDLTPEEKYFYIYLMTNSKTTQCGVYSLHNRIIETETGYNRETVEKLIQRFIEYKKIYYCEETKEVYLVNWIKHNMSNSPKVQKCIKKEIDNIKNKEFVKKSIENLNMPNHLKMRMTKLIKAQQMMNLNNLEKDWDKSNYKCNKCRDLTFIINDGVATPCECRIVKEAKDILRKSGISEEFRNKNFENFKTINDSQAINAYNKAIKYSNNFHIIKNNTQNSIMFMGQSGSGKTHLSLSIANVLMDNGVGVVYMGYRDVITQIKQNIMDEVYYNKIMNRYKNAKVLLIDDLFKGSISKSDINIMFELINHRYFNKLPVIVSTELSIENLVNIDEALGSRLIEMSKDFLVGIRNKKLNYRIYG